MAVGRKPDREIAQRDIGGLAEVTAEERVHLSLGKCDGVRPPAARAPEDVEDLLLRAYPVRDGSGCGGDLGHPCRLIRPPHGRAHEGENHEERQAAEAAQPQHRTTVPPGP